MLYLPETSGATFLLQNQKEMHMLDRQRESRVQKMGAGCTSWFLLLPQVESSMQLQLCSPLMH